MDHMMYKLAEKGFNEIDIAKSLRAIPIHSDMITAVKELEIASIPVYILSDANSVFIEVILKV